MTGAGEPPMPGMSNRMTPRRGRRPTRARPVPGRSFPAGRGQDMSMVIDVCSRRVADRRQTAAAGLIRGRLLLTTVLGQPARVVRPPGADTGLCEPEPVLRILRVVLGHLVSRLVVSGWIDHRGDVPAGGQHEPTAAGEQLGGPVTALPGADVVGDPGDYVTVTVDQRQIHR